MTLKELNQLNPEQCFDWFQQTCAAQIWCEKMVAARPFQDIVELQSTASDLWKQCNQQDYLQAFEAHPMIGDVNSLREKFQNTKAVASNEQSGAAEADEATLTALHSLNHEYLNRHGFIFIVFATGKSAQQMLALLQERLPNDTQEEIQIAAAEQLKITLLRINKQLQLEDAL